MASTSIATSGLRPIPDILRRVDEAIDFSFPEILVRVGDPPKFFRVHEALVRKHSPFFETAMQLRWQGKTRIVVLRDDTAHAFNIYMNWLYRHNICFDMPTVFSSSDDVDQAWICVIHAYILGDELLDDHFRDALTDTVIRSGSRVPSPPILHVLYDNTVPGSPLRRLMVHSIAREQDQLACVHEGWPPALVIDLIRYLQFQKHDLGINAFVTETLLRYLHLPPDASTHESAQLSTFATGTIRFSVDNPPTVFSMNERLLRKCQPSLDFNVKSREARAWILEAGEVDDGPSNVYLNWLCSGKICIDYTLDSWNDHGVWIAIARAYNLSQQVVEPDFADAIMDVVALMIKQDHPGFDSSDFMPVTDVTLDCIYDTVDDYSLLYRILAHKFASLNNIYDLIAPCWPNTFLCNVGEELAKRLQEGAMANSTYGAALACSFYAHAIKEECYRIKAIWSG